MVIITIYTSITPSMMITGAQWYCRSSALNGTIGDQRSTVLQELSAQQFYRRSALSAQGTLGAQRSTILQAINAQRYYRSSALKVTIGAQRSTVLQEVSAQRYYSAQSSTLLQRSASKLVNTNNIYIHSKTNVFAADGPSNLQNSEEHQAPSELSYRT